MGKVQQHKSVHWFRFSEMNNQRKKNWIMIRNFWNSEHSHLHSLIHNNRFIISISTISLQKNSSPTHTKSDFSQSYFSNFFHRRLSAIVHRANCCCHRFLSDRENEHFLSLMREMDEAYWSLFFTLMKKLKSSFSWLSARKRKFCFSTQFNYLITGSNGVANLHSVSMEI